MFRNSNLDLYIWLDYCSNMSIRSIAKRYRKNINNKSILVCENYVRNVIYNYKKAGIFEK